MIGPYETWCEKLGGIETDRSAGEEKQYVEYIWTTTYGRSPCESVNTWNFSGLNWPLPYSVYVALGSKWKRRAYKISWSNIPIKQDKDVQN